MSIDALFRTIAIDKVVDGRMSCLGALVIIAALRSMVVIALLTKTYGLAAFIAYNF